MKDIIDELNQKERLRRSIIKYWNVNYLENSLTEEAEKADEIFKRLEEEAAMDEAKKMEEIDAILLEAQMREEAGVYNATTGTYSGIYGRKEVDETTKEKIDKILHEKAEAIRELIEQEGDIEP